MILTSSSVPEGEPRLAVSFAVYAALIRRRALLVISISDTRAITRARGSSRDGRPRRAFDRRPLAVGGPTFPWSGPRLPADAWSPGDPLWPFVSGHVPRLLGHLRDSYDCIVIDSPPLLAVAEARLLAAMADKVLSS